jgi:hypothetical protein
MLDKYLTVKELSTLLKELPVAARLRCNAVGNIAVSTDKDSYIGFIDFMAKEVDVDLPLKPKEAIDHTAH